jgi:hypothetical protein
MQINPFHRDLYLPAVLLRVFARNPAKIPEFSTYGLPLMENI